MRKRKHRNSFSSASAHNPKSPDKVELLFSFEISFSLVRLACTARPEVKNLPLKPKALLRGYSCRVSPTSCQVSPAYVTALSKRLSSEQEGRVTPFCSPFCSCNRLSISRLAKSLKSPLSSVTRKGRSFDVTFSNSYSFQRLSSLVPISYDTYLN